MGDNLRGNGFEEKEMSNLKYTDKQLKKKYGMRFCNGIIVFFPQEYGYRCPKGHSNITWSEFNDHLWCYDCKKDYHYADDCVLIEDKLNPKFLPKQPRVIVGIKNFMPDGNTFYNIPKEMLKEKK